MVHTENPQCLLEELLTERHLALLGHASTGKSPLTTLLGHICSFSKFEVDSTYQLLHRNHARAMSEFLVTLLGYMLCVCTDTWIVMPQ